MGKIDEIIEELADIEHQRWGDWYKWQRDNSNAPNISRWDRQSETNYKDLSEQEKERDREQVRRYLPLLRQALTDYKEETLKLIKEEITWANIEGDKTSRLTSLFNKIAENNREIAENEIQTK